MTSTMKRWELTDYGAGNLRLADAPVPTPKPGDVLVRVKAASLNYRDKLVINDGMGFGLNFPFTPGSDMAGVVEATGEGVHRFKPQDRVISTFRPGWIDGAQPLGDARNLPYHTLGGVEPGVLAEYVCFPEDWFVAAPASLDDAQASTLPCAGLTAWFALVERGGLHAGHTVVVQGTGGVALFGLQIARAHGADVIVTSSSAEKRERVKALGASHVIDRTAEDWAEAVWRLTDNRGADQILEVAGGANFGKSLQAAAVGGHIAVIGLLEGNEISGPVRPLLLKTLTISGISVGHRRALEDLVRATDRARIEPVIAHRYDFTELHAALDHLEQGPFGKIVIELK